MQNPFALNHGYGCAITIIFLFVIGSLVFGQEKEQTAADKIKKAWSALDSAKVNLEAELIKKYETEIEKLKKKFDQVYLQIATNDPIVVNRMNQLLEAHSQAVSIMTAMNVFDKLVRDIKSASASSASESKNMKE